MVSEIDFDQWNGYISDCTVGSSERRGNEVPDSSVVVVVVVALYSASRSASNALLVPTAQRGAGVSVEASSIPSDPQRRNPDDQTRCDGVVEPSTGDGWSI